MAETATHPECTLHDEPFNQCCCACVHRMPVMHHCTTSPELRSENGGCCCHVQKGWACVNPELGVVHDNWPEHSIGCECFTAAKRGQPQEQTE